MTRTLKTQPLSKSAFKTFGDILEASGTPDKMINQEMCGRYHDLAQLDFGNGKAGISIFDAQARNLPFELEMMERHPEGSQAFAPMQSDPFLVVVAQDKDGAPDTPQAFIVASGQGINFHRNTWHGVLCPLKNSGLFLVVDRIGTGENLQEHWFEEPWLIE